MGRALRTTHATQGGIALISGGPRDAVMMSREADGLHQQDLSPRHGQSLFGGTGAQQDPGSHQAIPPRSHTPSLLNGSPDDAILDVRQVQMDPSRLEMPQQVHFCNQICSLISSHATHAESRADVWEKHICAQYHTPQ